METHRIPAKSAGAFAVEADASFSVVTPEPRQVADLVAFVRGNPAEAFAQSYTRDLNGRLRISTGDALYTTAGRELLTITDDDCGVHDIMFGPCTEWMLTDRPTDEGYQNEPGGCRENLALALDAYGLDTAVPNTMNVFQRSTVTDQVHFDVRESPASAGDAVTFRAERDAVVAVSACSAKGVASGTTLTPIDVAVPDGTEVSLASVHDDRP
ncbi:urea carboxylase-associated family protein [Halorussus limi]|uniref:Urea carboxylase-associated family protein n=1 Tax=Halorussus limi TaxID=2938695 RepID=A0A8U0HVK5_9EURY|nr:urea carboxylase-associated family protein [Halorussus limi]UPV74726.1 urea carboxylase-associated family protein [Halorussus limi]